MIDLKNVFPEQLETSCYVDAVFYNSKLVTPTSVFVALKGEKVDGHKFVKQAFADGAVAVVVEEYNPKIVGNQIVVEDTQQALAEISQALFPIPKELLFMGVTGTDGKTSTTVLVKNLLQKLGKSVGYIGTNGIEYTDVYRNLNCTTPLAPELFSILADMELKRVDAVSMEVSSHGLVNKRVANIQFDYAVFTNFSRDHLDFHKTIEEYKKAKLLLFKQLKSSGTAIINIDDIVAQDFIQASSHAKVITYGLKNNDADFFATDIAYTPTGMEFVLHYDKKEILVKTKLLGEFNIYNLLVAIILAYDQGYALDLIVENLAELDVIPGRMEVFYNIKRQFSAIVDFGHAPNAIKNVLEVARKMTDGKLVIITGAVGDGDRKKRPIMAKNAVTYADEAIFTTDQPYSEEPVDIIQEMVADIDATNYRIILDREQAIKTALDEASIGDIVVVMGKGRETQIKFKDHVVDFSDYEFVKAYMED